jgi:hypothetical protein
MPAKRAQRPHALLRKPPVGRRNPYKIMILDFAMRVGITFE